MCEEALLEKNLKILDHIQQQTGAKILLALKAFSLWKTFPLVRKYLQGVCASGLYEARLGFEELGKEVHTYSPAFKEKDFEEILKYSNKIVFNSWNQCQKFKPMIQQSQKNIQWGLRINPNYSEVETLLYNPCAPGSRLGLSINELKEKSLEGISGLHFHTMCEQNSDTLERTLQKVEEQFGSYFHQIKWINFGGGHHITRKDYDVSLLIQIIQNFKSKYDLEIYLEPGEAIGWETGFLIAEVLDIVHNQTQIAILDTSAENHMPDCLAMPYRPNVRNSGHPNEYPYSYRLAGNTCLAGDIIGDYSFQEPLKVGDKIIFEDMIHYTIVKNTTFNGIQLPSIGLIKKNGDFELFNSFSYAEYKNRNA